MNWKLMQGTAKERLSISAKNKVKFLLIMILIVTFEHTFTMINYFSKSLISTTANFGLVIWIDLMMFFCLDLINNHSGGWRKALGWFVFAAIVLISGFLNIFYMIHHAPEEFSQIIAMLLSFMIGGVMPLSIIFLGTVYSESSGTIINIQAKRMNGDEPKPVHHIDPEVRKSKSARDQQILDMLSQGVGKTEISRRLKVHRNTIYNVIKENNALSEMQIQPIPNDTK